MSETAFASTGNCLHHAGKSGSKRCLHHIVENDDICPSISQLSVYIPVILSIEPLAKVRINRFCHSERSEESLIFQGFILL